MRAILKQVLYLSIALVGLYGALLVLSYALVPTVSGRAGLDTHLAADSIFATEQIGRAHV